MLMFCPQVEPELKRAGEVLGKANFLAATASQQAVIKGLTALLERLEEAQGLADGDRHRSLGKGGEDAVQLAVVDVGLLVGRGGPARGRHDSHQAADAGRF